MCNCKRYTTVVGERYHWNQFQGSNQTLIIQILFYRTYQKIDNKNFLYDFEIDLTAGLKQREAWLQSLINKRVACSLPTKHILMFPTNTMTIDDNIKVWLSFYGKEEGGVVYSEVLLNNQIQRRQHVLKIQRSGVKNNFGRG